MKFGVFLPNGSNGYTPSHGSPVYLPTYQHNLDITVEAERQGLDFVLSMMKFKGFGGETGYWDSCLDSFTLSAALAARTSRINLIASVPILSMHPALAARGIATIDDISGGRCGLNIITGWNKPEYVQMGMWPGDNYYEDRYDYAREYIEVVRAIWAGNEVRYDGRYFQLDQCTVLPKPVHDVTIVCAGQSPKGLEFTVQNGDYSFIMAQEPELMRFVGTMHERAAQVGREVGTLALYTIITAPTDAEARRIGEDVIAKVDKGAVANILRSAAMDTNAGGTADRMQAGLSLSLEEGNLAFMGFPVLWGSPETIASKISDIHAATGVEGMMFNWLDFVPGIREFGEQIMPKLRI